MYVFVTSSCCISLRHTATSYRSAASCAGSIRKHTQAYASIRHTYATSR